LKTALTISNKNVKKGEGEQRRGLRKNNRKTEVNQV
jgi:hypothetical protein